nr:hypothetical protein [Enterococcus phage Sw5]
MKYTEKDIKEGMKLRCTDNNGYIRWTTGGVYEVKKTDEGVLYIEDVEGGCRSYIDAILFRLNHKDESAIFEVIEEKPMRLAKVTRLYPSDGGLVEVGRCYQVLEETPKGRVRIYLNRKLGNHVLHPDQFVFVDEPSNDGEADSNHDMSDLEKIEAKITALSEESYQLFEKSEELSTRAIELQDESIALEEALYTIKQYL